MEWFAIPRWERIAETYEGAVKAVLKVVREKWRYEVCNYIDGADVDVRRHKNGTPKAD